MYHNTTGRDGFCCWHLVVSLLIGQTVSEWRLLNFVLLWASLCILLNKPLAHVTVPFIRGHDNTGSNAKAGCQISTTTMEHGYLQVPLIHLWHESLSYRCICSHYSVIAVSSRPGDVTGGAFVVLS